MPTIRIFSILYCASSSNQTTRFMGTNPMLSRSYQRWKRRVRQRFAASAARTVAETRIAPVSRHSDSIGMRRSMARCGDFCGTTRHHPNDRACPRSFRNHGEWWTTITVPGNLQRLLDSGRSARNPKNRRGVSIDPDGEETSRLPGIFTSAKQQRWTTLHSVWQDQLRCDWNDWVRHPI